MSITVAAMKGKFGSTNYFLLSMKAQELVGKVVFPTTLDGWDNLTLEEREQRDINHKRVENTIAPYLTKDKDRFFGSVIVTATGMDPDTAFEHISEATKGVPNAYKNKAENMGFLTIEGGVQLIPLDGQHRLMAIKCAISGRNYKEQVLTKVTADSTLANEDVSVILIPHDKKKSRKIFTKVNRYAKATTAGQNLVTDDDDIVAILARNIANNRDIIGARLVKYKKNELSDTDEHFTTLPIVAECCEAILTCFPEKVERTEITESQTALLYKNKVEEVWKFLVKHIELFAILLGDKGEGGDPKRREIRKVFLLGKPVPQACLVKVFVRLTAQPTDFSYEQAAKKLNAVDWRIKSDCWDRLLITGGKTIITKNRALVTDVLCCQLGEKLSEVKKAEVLNKYRALFPADEQKGITELPKLTK